MTWVINVIRVMYPIRPECIAEDGCRVLILRDVVYWIDAHFDLSTGVPRESAGRQAAMSKRSARTVPAVFLGRAGFEGHAALIDPQEPVPLAAEAKTVDHGWLLHSIEFTGDRRPRFFRAEAVGGLVRVPTADSPLLFG